ncbi:MAG: hypothetical protein KDC24_01335 [Saprospiraceae bacterium]|nr:hypothetical protein [Saprospiraceae bacterium]
MQESRLWQVFEKLSLKDLRELEKVVLSPYFNQRDYVANLFELLREEAKNTHTPPSKAHAFAKLFPDKQYDDHLMRNAMSLLLQTIERYISVRDFQEDSFRPDLELGKAYRRMNLEKHYWQSLKKAERSVDDNPYRNADHFNNTYQLEAEKYQWLSAQRRMTSLNLQEISDNLDLSYITQKLRQTCFSISHQAVYPQQYDFGLLDKTLELLETGAYLDTPAVAVYYYCYRALTEENSEESFRKFKSLLILHGELFPLLEQRDLYLLATNYCIKKMNAGQEEYAKEGLDIYKEALERGALYVDGRLSRFTFFNIVTKCLVCEEYDWADFFIQKYQEYLSPKYRESTASYSMARLEYQRGNPENALQLLQKADYEDLLQNLQAKAIMAKIFYEADDWEVLYSHLDAMQQFIRRKKVIGYHQELFVNFIQVLRRWMDVAAYDEKARTEIADLLDDLSPVAEKKWLTRMINE